MEKNIRFFPMLKFFSNRRTIDYFEGKQIFPINIEFSLSGVCPANCRKCFYRVNNYALKGLENKYFDFNRIPSLIEEFKECGVKSISWTGGGEPTMHPNFPDIVKLFHKAGIQQGLFTNALPEIKYDPNLFEWIRVTKTNKPFPLENIKKLRPCKTVGLCINYSEGDDDIVKDGIIIAEALDKIKSDGQETYLQIRPEMNTQGELHECKLPEIKHPLVELTEKHSVTEYGRGYTKCEAYHFTPFIWQDGEVNVCAYHKGDKDYILGDLYKQSFEEIMLKAPKSVNVRKDCQACCKLHEMNKAIEQRKHLTDINFI
jgi:GTP 3',8-cyclase